jgi:hypothetical protein
MTTAPAGSPIKAASSSALAVSRSQLEAAGTWGFAEDGTPPGLRQFVRALDEKLINAMQETTMNVTRFFMSKVRSCSPLTACMLGRFPIVCCTRCNGTVYYDNDTSIRDGNPELAK